jgi:uncharacterized protein
MQSQTKVVIDTNMIISCVNFKIDLFEEIRKLLGNVEIIITENIKNELEKLKKDGKNMEKTVNIAEKLLERNGIKVEESRVKPTDNELVELASKGFIIATNDKDLKQTIKRNSGQFLFIRKRKFIERG